MISQYWISICIQNTITITISIDYEYEYVNVWYYQQTLRHIWSNNGTLWHNLSFTPTLTDLKLLQLLLTVTLTVKLTVTAKQKAKR